MMDGNPYGYGNGSIFQQSAEAFQGGQQWPMQQTALAPEPLQHPPPLAGPPPLDMAIGSPAPALGSSPEFGSLAPPIRPYGGLQVEAEDCEAANSYPSLPPWAGPSALAKHKGKVYVQHDRDTSRFRRVGKDQVRKAYQAGGAGRGTAGDTQQRNSLIVPASRGIAILKDPDAARLRFEDPQDAEICELLAGCQQVEVNAAILFFTLQAILGGICVIAGCLVYGAGDTEELVLVLNALKPGLGSLMLILSEVTSVGSVLRFFRAYEHTLRACWSCNCGEMTNLFRQNNTSMSHRLRSAAPALHAASNMALVGSCLAGSRNDLIMHIGPWPGSGGWDSQLSIDGLTAQAVLGLLSLLFALPEIFEFITKAQADSPVPASPNGNHSVLHQIAHPAGHGNVSAHSAGKAASQASASTLSVPAILDSTLHSASSAASLR